MTNDQWQMADDEESNMMAYDSLTASCLFWSVQIGSDAYKNVKNLLIVKAM